MADLFVPAAVSLQMKNLLLNKWNLLLIPIVVIVCSIAYWFWAPGIDLQDGRNDLGANGIWMQHGWLGDDGWFERNHKDKAAFRTPLKLKSLADQYRREHLRDLFPHLCPCSKSGAIAPSNAEQCERFLDAFSGFRVIPWVGGITRTDTLLSDANWRKAFAKSCADLLSKHPRFAGIHIDIELIRSGDQDFLLLLEEIRKEIPKGKLISVAAFPPPAITHPTTWDESYSRQVAARVDQVAVMMYDSSLRLPKFYQQLMKDWTERVLSWYAQDEVLLGLPAYDDATALNHDPKVENIANALLGIHAALIKQPLPANYKGVCIYCEWVMTEDKWKEFEEHFLSK